MIKLGMINRYVWEEFTAKNGQDLWGSPTIWCSYCLFLPAGLMVYFLFAILCMLHKCFFLIQWSLPFLHCSIPNSFSHNSYLPLEICRIVFFSSMFLKFDTKFFRAFPFSIRIYFLCDLMYVFLNLFFFSILCIEVSEY